MLDPDSVSVVIIGPMGGGSPLNASEIALQNHLTSIGAAVIECGKRLKEGGAKFNLIPTSADSIQFGDINETVWRNIDLADFAIADISTRSPNVFYELAVLHALGKPTILLDSESYDDIPFYLKSQRICKVKTFSVEELARVLLDSISALLSVRSPTYYWNNVITNFYTVPLVDSSAATGLATGYFHNFIKRVIMDEFGLLDRLAHRSGSVDRNFTHLIIVQPKSITDMSSTMNELIRLPGWTAGNTADDNSKYRGLTYNTVGNFIVDYPSHLSLVASTPSFVKVRELMRHFPSHDEGLINKLEIRFIDAYLRMIRKLAYTTPQVNPARLKIVAVEELRHLLESQQA